MIQACINGEIAVVKSLITKFKANVNFRDGDTLDTPLLEAAKSGLMEVSKTLLQHGAEIELGDATGATALFYAAKHGNQKLAEFLITKGAEIEHRNIYGMTPLLAACKFGQFEVVEKLLEFKADINSSDIYGHTPLIAAAYHGHCEIVKLLLTQQGIKVDAKDECGWTALISAVFHNHFHVTKTLVEFGVKVNQVEDHGLSALFFAIKNNNLELCEYLLQHEADPNIKTNEIYAYYCSETEKSVEIGASWTPLMFACSVGKIDFIKCLLEHGADSRPTSVDGKTAFDLAPKNDLDLKKLLNIGSK